MGRSISKRPARNRQAGFTLPEVLIAVAIFSAATAALLPVYSNSLRLAQANEARSVARLHLQSLLAALGRSGPIEAGERSGELGRGYSWALAVEPYGDPTTVGGRTVRAFRVTASVSWRDAVDEKAISLTTLRLSADDGP
mgnify:FL=1